jgi:RinA family phage transcriptional activator
MLKQKLKSATFKHIESELFNYHLTVKLLAQRREEILYGSSQPDDNIGGGKSNLPGDPTGRIAIALVSDKRIQHLENIVNAITTVTNQLHPERLEFVKLRYWTQPQTLTWVGIALQLNCGRSTLFNWREDIVTAIAEHMGWE